MNLTPGSLIHDIACDKTYFVIAVTKLSYPGSWETYELTLLRDNRINSKSVEIGCFHNCYDVFRP